MELHAALQLFDGLKGLALNQSKYLNLFREITCFSHKICRTFTEVPPLASFLGASSFAAPALPLFAGFFGGITKQEFRKYVQRMPNSYGKTMDCRE